MKTFKDFKVSNWFYLKSAILFIAQTIAFIFITIYRVNSILEFIFLFIIFVFFMITEFIMFKLDELSLKVKALCNFRMYQNDMGFLVTLLNRRLKTIKKELNIR